MESFTSFRPTNSNASAIIINCQDLVEKVIVKLEVDMNLDERVNVSHS